MEGTNETKTKRAPLPRYRSHKVVEAAKIDGVGMKGGGGALLTLTGPDWPGTRALDVSQSWFDRATAAAGVEALVGGYYVRYADGWDSWSPGGAFEDGYRPEGDEVPTQAPSHAALLQQLWERLELEQADPKLQCPQNAEMLVILKQVRQRLFARDARREAAMPGGATQRTSPAP